jgi:multidrug resistance efflux pump
MRRCGRRWRWPRRRPQPPGRGVRENEVRLHEAQLTLARLNRLIASGLSTQAEVEAAQAQVDSYDARILPSHFNIETPVDAVIAQLLAAGGVTLSRSSQR